MNKQIYEHQIKFSIKTLQILVGIHCIQDFILVYGYKCFVCMYACASHVCRTNGSQKRLLDSP